MKKSIFLGALALAGCSLFVKKSEFAIERGPSSYADETAASGQTLNFETFKNTVTKFNTIELGLESLRTLYPDYLKFHTLVYDSGSIQGATFVAPRVLVFGPKADFVFSFISDFR